jgi:ribose 5-phosphate isomerase A
MQTDSKRLAAEKAVEWIENGMVIGLGTGSTAYFAIQKIGEKIKQGMHLRAVATSVQTEHLAAEFGIPLVPFCELNGIDLTIDGADEVDAKGNLIKGGGGALLREKLVAFHTRTYLIAVDETKLVDTLGQFPLPVEIVPFAHELTLKKLEENFGSATIRQKDGNIFITDNGNLIADLNCYPIADPETLNTSLHQVPGVVETGLFSHQLVSMILVGKGNGEVVIYKGQKS